MMTTALTAKMRETIPAKYTAPGETPFRITVPRQGTNDVVLDIK